MNIRLIKSLIAVSALLIYACSDEEHSYITAYTPEELAEHAAAKSELKKLGYNSKSFNGYLNEYAKQLVASTNNNIFGFKIDGDTIFFQTSDPNLIADLTADEDKNPVAYVRNVAITTGWGIKFCTPELKLILRAYGVTSVDGQLIDAKTKSLQTMSRCRKEAINIDEELNKIQVMKEKMDLWNH